MQSPQAASSAPQSSVYHRRQPEQGTLYEVVRDNLQTLYAAIEDGFASPLPAFVRDEFERYMDCGLLCRGFARLECESCHEQRLVAFSCKGRGFCPSCLGRRMAQSAANLVEHVLPAVALRQFVVTFPFELRARLAYDGKLLSSVTRIAIDSVLGFYKRRVRDEQNIEGQSGAVSVVQRVSSDLRLNPHLHAIVLDGIFVLQNDSVVFHPLARLVEDNLVRIELKRAFRDGTVAIDLDPLSLLCRLAASVPPPGFHLVYYAGVLGAASKLRALVIPPPPDEPSSANPHAHTERPATHRSHYRPWAELMKRAFDKVLRRKFGELN